MAKTIHNHTEGSVYFKDGVQRLELSRNYHVTAYLLELEVSHDNEAGAEVFNDDLFGLIGQISLVTDGTNNIKQIDGRKLALNSKLFFGQSPISTIDLSNGAGKKSKAAALLTMVLPDSARSYDTIFNTRLYKSLDLNVTWADPAKFGANITVNDDTKLTITALEIVGYVRNGATDPITFYKEVYSQKEVTSTSTNFTIDIPVHNAYKGFFVTVDTDGKYDDTVINSFRLKSGTRVFLEQSAASLAVLNKLNYRIQSGEDMKGIYYLDLTPRGRNSELLDTITKNGFNTLTLEMDVKKPNSGTTFINYYSEIVEATGLVETQPTKA